MSSARALITIRAVIILCLITLPALHAKATSDNPRFYIQSTPLPKAEYIVGLATKLSKNQFVVHGHQLASASELPKTKTALLAWAKTVQEGVVIIWNPNHIEQSVGFSSLMRTIDSLGRVAVIMVAQHEPSPKILEVKSLKIEKFTPNCELQLNWVNPTRKIK